jgi:hypothetical protein
MLSTVLFVAMALTATAHADPTEVSPVAPVTGSWSVGIGPVAEMVPSSTTGALGTAGVELGVGKRMSDVYLGVTGELSYIYGYPNLMGASFSTGVPSLRGRAGLELRYALMSWQGYTTCWGNYQPAGSFWVGLRVGPENVDGTFGTFGDVSVGFDHWYLRAGVSIDPAGTYGEQVLMGKPVAGLPGDVTPFVGTGIRLLFG